MRERKTAATTKLTASSAPRLRSDGLVHDEDGQIADYPQGSTFFADLVALPGGEGAVEPRVFAMRFDGLIFTGTGTGIATEINPLTNGGVGSWTNIDGLNGGVWIDTGTKHGVLFAASLAGKTNPDPNVCGSGHVFYSNEGQNKGICSHGCKAVIDIAARKVVARYPLAGCEGPTGIAYVPEGKRLIVACDGVAGVVDAATGQMLKTIKIGDGADGVAYDPVRKLAYVPAGRDGTLAVLSVSAKDVVLAETVATQEGARTLAVDPESGKVYLPAATMGKPVKGRRPVQEPGSFVVLVVGQ